MQITERSLAEQASSELVHERATTTSPKCWPPEVEQFAVHEQVAEYLEPLAEMTRHVFPSRRQFAVSVEEDPETADDRHVVFDIEATGLDTRSAADAHQVWHSNLLEICPPTLACTFCLRLELAH